MNTRSQLAEARGDGAISKVTRRKFWASAFFTSVVVASVALFFVSRGKWSDAIIDSGREWIVPDALARGDLLYRDVVYWFGPFTPYFHAAFFRLLGSSFRTLVLTGVVGSVGVLAALWFALRRVTGRAEATLWTALAIPALVFMPNAGGSILGMGYRMWHAAAFALLATGMLVGGSRRSVTGAVGAGALCGMAGLCRTEWGIACVAACMVAVLVRRNFRAGGFLEVSAIISGFVLIFGGTLAAFVLISGPQAVIRDGHVLLTGLPPETRRFFVAFSGISDWRTGLAQAIYSAAMWLGVVLLLEIAATGAHEQDRTRKRATRIAAVVILLGASALAGGASGAVLFSAAPAVCVIATAVGLARRDDPRDPALVAFGLLGLVLSYRRPFHIGDSGYVGPSLLFAFVCSAGLLQRFLDRNLDCRSKSRLRPLVNTAILCLICVAFLARAWQYLSDRRVRIAGAEGMLSARSEVSHELATISAAIRARTLEGDSLVVLPEGEILNYLSKRSNPIRHKLLIPGYLTDQNEAAVLADLVDAKPNAVVLLNRSTSEYGPSGLGQGYGRAIRSWIEANYRLSPFDSRQTLSARTHPWALVGFRKK